MKKTWRRLETSENKIAYGNNKKRAVKSVKHSAVTGKEFAEILDFAFPFYV